MAKKKSGKKDGASRTDSVRAAVDQAFQATAQATADAGQLTRGRATEIADELVGNIARLRDALEDARPASAEDVKELRAEVAALVDRVRVLETDRAAAAIAGAPDAKPAAAKRSPSAAKPAAAKRSTAAAKPAAAKRSTAAAKPAAAKRSTAAAKPAAAKRSTAAAKPKPTSAARAKPAAKPKPAAPAKTGAATPGPSGS